MKVTADRALLHRLMAERGLTMTALAERAGVSVPTVSRALRGAEITVTSSARIQRALSETPVVPGPSILVA